MNKQQILFNLNHKTAIEATKFIAFLTIGLLLAIWAGGTMPY